MDEFDFDLFLSNPDLFWAEQPTLWFHKETMMNPVESTSSKPPPKPNNHMETFSPTNNRVPPVRESSSPFSTNSFLIDLTEPTNDINLGLSATFSSTNNQVPPVTEIPSPLSTNSFLIDLTETANDINLSFSSKNNQVFSVTEISSPFPTNSLLIDLTLPANDINVGLLHPYETTEQILPTNPTPLPFDHQSLLIEPDMPVLTNQQEQLPTMYFPAQTLPINLDNQPQGFLDPQYILPNSSSEYLQCQRPREVGYRRYSSNFANCVDDLSQQDPEAFSSFLAGAVRPGPDVPQIYKCNQCSMEFPNAQAFGGHMSSHSKNKRAENLGVGEGHSSKRRKLGSTKASTSNSSKSEENKRKCTKRGNCNAKKSD